jgi:hypothetical protein
VYFFWLPDSFYHSTVQFEYLMMNKTANEILEGIRRSMVQSVAARPQAEGCGGWRNDPDSVRVTSLDARDGKVSFPSHFLLSVKPGDDKCQPFSGTDGGVHAIH